MNSLNKNNKWIFLVPIDGNTNKSIQYGQNEISNDDQGSKIQTNNEKEELSEEDLKKNENEKEKNINIEKKGELKIFSKSKNLSIADSSKIYMSEFLKKNWKIKIKRLIIKLKKRYTKKAENLIYEESQKSIINNNIENNNLINIFNDSSNLNNNINNNINTSDNNLYNNNLYNNNHYNLNNLNNSYKHNINYNYNALNEDEKIKNH